MDEFAALAQRVVLTLDDVRGCLVLSRDGLVLGAFPEDREAELKPAWLRFTHVGEARKGFVEFSDQLWAFVHRGPYSAFVVTGTTVRPGVMLDQLEQAVIAAEEARAKQKEVTFKVPDAQGAPSGRPRTSLHPSTDRPAPVAATPAEEGPAAAPVENAPQRPLSGYRQPDPAAGPAPRGDVAPARPGSELTGGARPSIEGSPYEAALSDEQEGARGMAPPDTPTHPASGTDPIVDAGGNAPSSRSEPQQLVSSDDAPEPSKDDTADEEAAEVDRVLLAKEFSGLLQLEENGDED